MAVFVLAPERGYDLMNPAPGKDKYVRRHQTLAEKLLKRSFDNRRRRVQAKDTGQGCHVPYSIAAYTQSSCRHARFAAIDVDKGGSQAVLRILEVCAAHGLWAFAELGTSDDHDGGHVYIPAETLQPASLLNALAGQLQSAADAAGETFPTPKKTLRLPLMPHLRAPGGPRRFPLLLPDGEPIEVTSPWAALEALRARFQPNRTEALTQAMCTLPPVSLEAPRRLHKSKVKTDHDDSIIKWFTTNYSLRDELGRVGVSTVERLVTCPWHDDRSPSLAIWRHHDGKEVCRCMSAQSNCPAAERPYLDAFDVHCLIEHTTAKEAARELAQRYNLGRKREVKMCRLSASGDLQTRWQQHAQTLEVERSQLQEELARAAERPGQVTIVRATPGLGKTWAARRLVQELTAAGKKVAVVAPTHKVAEEEWAAHLDEAYVWRPRVELCSCYDRNYLQSVPKLGYALPPCRPGCSYEAQHQEAEGQIVIYQHNHLHLHDGKLLLDADVVLVDESPLDAHLVQRQASRADLEQLLTHLDAQFDDPALPLVKALLKVTSTTT
jgi:hypothetical protein